MAIVNMKRIYLLAMKENQEAILKVMQKHGTVEISNITLDSTPKEQEQIQNPDIERLYWCIHYLGKYGNVKKPLFASEVYIDNSEANNILSKRLELFKIIQRCEEIEREKGRIQTEILKKRAEIDELEPWKNLDIDLKDLSDTQSTKFFMGEISNTALETIKNDKKAQGLLYYVEVISEKSGQSYIYVIAHKSSYDEINKIFKDEGFTPAKFPESSRNIPMIIESAKDEINKIESSTEKFNSELTDLAKNIPDLEKLYDLLNIEFQRQVQKNKLINTKSAFSLKGWVPEPSVDSLLKDLQSISKNMEIEISDPDKDDEPPILLKNSSLVTPFESIVKGFSYPAPGGIDPTAVMAPFFANFFGMMLSDAGYGLMMVIAIPIIIKVFNPKVSIKNMMKLLFWGGIATVVWGALFNTWFGFSPLPIALNPMNAPMPVMAVCIALGAVHLFAGLGVAAYMNIRKGDYIEAVYSQLSWAVMLIGLGLLIVPSLSKIGAIMAAIGAITIVLTAGRDKGNIFSRLVSGFGALYGVMSWISDLLSYMRLFGMGLATGVIGMVINKLIGMAFQGGIVGVILGSILFVGAHLFNFGINALGAYVHSCRLQYIEFFGKFYEDGGKPFVPLEEKTRYIKLLNNK